VVGGAIHIDQRFRTHDLGHQRPNAATSGLGESLVVVQQHPRNSWVVDQHAENRDAHHRAESATDLGHYPGQRVIDDVDQPFVNGRVTGHRHQRTSTSAGRHQWAMYHNAVRT
jgi:hypothetical protein